MIPSRYSEVHSKPQGPGDSRPTALQIIADEGLIGKLANKTMLITGCSSGIGIETARALSATGAKLFLTARNIPKAKIALHDILEPDRVELLEMDMDSLASIRSAAQELNSKTQSLNILICNAGVMAIPSPGTKTKDGFETQFGVNHLAHFLLFNLVKPLLLSSATEESNSRVVMVSSSGHRTSSIIVGDYGFEKEEYTPWKAYGQSKTANILMANEITRRYSSLGLQANSLMPGGIATGLQVHIPREMLAQMGTHPGIKSLGQGASTSVFAAVGKECEGVGGRYLEDCGETERLPEGWKPDARSWKTKGAVSHAFDEELGKRLWKDSLEMVGLKDDE